MRWIPWVPTRAHFILGSVGAVVGMVAGYGNRELYLGQTSRPSMPDLVGTTLDGRHVTALAVVPLVLLSSWRVGSYLGVDDVRVRVGGWFRLTLPALFNCGVHVAFVWGLLTVGYLSQMLGLPLTGPGVRWEYVASALSAQPLALLLIATVVCVTRMLRPRLAVWLVVGLLMWTFGTWAAPDGLPQALRVLSYLRTPMWTDGLWMFVSAGFVLVAGALAWADHPRALARLNPRGWGSLPGGALVLALAAMLVAGTEASGPGTVADGLTRVHEGVSSQGVSLTRFSFGLVLVLAPAWLHLHRAEGRVPQILPLLAVRGRSGTRWLAGELASGAVAAVVLFGVVAAVGVIVLLLGGAGLRTAELPGLMFRVVIIGALQSTVFLGMALLVRARSTSPNLALVTLLLAGLSMLFAPIAPWLPIGHQAAGIHSWDAVSLAGSTTVLLIALGCLLLSSPYILESRRRRRSHDGAHPGLGHQVLPRPHHR